MSSLRDKCFDLARQNDQRSLTESTPPPALKLVQLDLDQRFQFGMKKYGRSVLANDGQDYLQHLYEEVLDAAVYLKALLQEKKNNEVVSGRD